MRFAVVLRVSGYIVYFVVQLVSFTFVGHGFGVLCLGFGVGLCVLWLGLFLFYL